MNPPVVQQRRVLITYVIVPLATGYQWMCQKTSFVKQHTFSMKPFCKQDFLITYSKYLLANNDNYGGDNYSGNDYYRGQIIRKTTVLEEIELGLFTGFEDMTALLEDKKGLTVVSAIAVVCCYQSIR